MMRLTSVLKEHKHGRRLTRAETKKVIDSKL